MDGIIVGIKNEILMPITDVSIESQEEVMLSQMMRIALAAIDMAKDNKGVLLAREPQHSKKLGISIKFSIIFPSKEEQQDFVEDLTDPVF